MATVIDELIIKIGLEVNDVKKEVAEVKKAVGSLDTQETKARTKKRKEEKVAHKEQVSNIKELEKTVLKFYAAISGGKALGAFVEDTVKSSANLERLSKSLNTSAGTLQKWSNVLYNVGGNGEEAINTIASLTDAVTSLKLRGDIEGVRWLSMIGVSVTDESGARKSASRLINDIRDAIKGRSPEEQGFIAKMLNIGPDLLYSMNKADEEWNKLNNDAERQSKIFDELSPKTQKWMESWRTFSSEMKSGGANLISNLLDTGAAKTAQDIMSGFKWQDYADFAKKEGFLNSVFKTIASPFLVASGLPLSMLDGQKDSSSSKSNNSSGSNFSSLIYDAAKKFGIDEKILHNLIKTESNFNPNAVSPQGARGIAQFLPSTAAEYGVDVNDVKSSIEGAAKYLSESLNYFDYNYEKAIASYHAGRGGVAGAIGKYGSDWLHNIGPKTEAYTNKVMSIGNITINTQATNAKEIARDIRGELAPLAESGMK